MSSLSGTGLSNEANKEIMMMKHREIMKLVEELKNLYKPPRKCGSCEDFGFKSSCQYCRCVDCHRDKFMDHYGAYISEMTPAKFAVYISLCGSCWRKRY